MRLSELYLDGFGRFHDQTIGPFSEYTTVVYGPNETGKSTLLAFIRAILFGFPTRGRNEHYPPLSGGRHGGRIRLSDDLSLAYTLERFAGARGGQVDLRTVDGEPLQGETPLERATGRITPDIFRNVFALSLDELQSEGLMNDAGIVNHIYSAALGVSKLPEFTKILSERKQRIFRPRGRSQIDSLLSDLENMDQQLQETMGSAGRYATRIDRKLEIEVELKGTDVELSQLNDSSVEIGNLLSGWDDWLVLRQCEVRLQEIPRYEQFPEDPIARLDGLMERARQVGEDVDVTAEQLRQSKEAVAAIIPNEDLIEVEGKIEDIRRARSSFDNSVRDLPERQSELAALESGFAENLRELGHNWCESDLEKCDTSLVIRNQVDYWKQHTAEAQASNQEARIRLEQATERLQDLQSEVLEAKEMLPLEAPLLDAAKLVEHQDTLRGARNLAGKWRQAGKRVYLSETNITGAENAGRAIETERSLGSGQFVLGARGG